MQYIIDNQERLCYNKIMVHRGRGLIITVL